VLNPDEHDEFAWVTPGEARDLELAAHFRRLLEQ
jgi:8-oxo-dGTP diphosphatase